MDDRSSGEKPSVDVEALRAKLREVARKEVEKRAPEVIMAVPSLVLDGLRREWTLSLRKAAEFVVPGTVALTISGFVICSVHYLQRGVPLSALSSTQFVAAGVSFAALTGLPIVLGFATGGESLRRRWGIWIFAALSVFVLTSMFSPGAAPFTSVYFGALAILTGSMSASSLRRVAPRALEEISNSMVEEQISLALGEVKDPASKPRAKGKVPSGYEVLGYTWLVTTFLFATWVFPNMPVWIGGGAPRSLDLTWEAPPKEDESNVLGGGSDKRCLFEVYKDQSYWYLLSVEPAADGNCARPPTLIPFRWGFLSSERFVVIPRSRVRIAVYRRGMSD